MTFNRAAHAKMPVAPPPVPAPPRARTGAGRRPVPRAVVTQKPQEQAEPLSPASPALEAVPPSASPTPPPPPQQTTPAPPLEEPPPTSGTPVETKSFQAEKLERLALLEVELQTADSPQKRLETGTRMLKMLGPRDLAALAKETSAAVRRPARLALEFIGEEDVSWSNVQKSLLAGKKFVHEVLAMEGDTYVTWKKLARLEEFGPLKLEALAGQSVASRALALYFDICMSVAKERLGATGPTPRIMEEPPEWPSKSSFDELPVNVLEAVRWGRTPLLVCDGFAREVDSLFDARGFVKIDAKSVQHVVVDKAHGVNQVHQSLHRQLAEGLLGGRPILVAMRDSAVPFRDVLCEDTLFPKAVFNNRQLAIMSADPTRLLLPGDGSEQPTQDASLIVGRARPECYSLVSTDLNIRAARDRLPDVLPHFSDMAIIEVLPP